MNKLFGATAAVLLAAPLCWPTAQAQNQTVAPPSSAQTISEVPPPSPVYPPPAQAMPAYPPPAQTQGFGASQPPAEPRPAQNAGYGAAPPMPESQPAATGTEPPAPQIGAAQPPQGPYTSSCKDGRMLGQSLVAFCRKPDGTWHTTQLSQAERCAGNIDNVNGDLTCGGGTAAGSSTPPPTAPAPPSSQLTPPPTGAAPEYPPAAGQGGAPTPNR